jgi:hypothetical protein
MLRHRDYFIFINKVLRQIILTYKMWGKIGYENVMWCKTGSSGGLYRYALVFFLWFLITIIYMKLLPSCWNICIIMDNREPLSLDTCIRDLTTSAGKIAIQNTIPPTAPDIIVRSGPIGNTLKGEHTLQC